MSLCAAVGVFVNVTLQRTNLFAGDGGGQSKQEESNDKMMMHITEPEDVIHADTQSHADLSALNSCGFTATVAGESAVKRIKVMDDERQEQSTASTESSVPMNVAQCSDDLASPVFGAAVAELSLDGLDAQLFDHSLPLVDAESIGPLSLLSACDLLEAQPSFLSPVSLQREDSLGVGMATQDAFQEKSFAAHEFALSPFSDLQTV